MPVDAGLAQVNKSLHAEAIMIHYPACLRQLFKLRQRFFKSPVVVQVKMGIQQVMHGPDVMTCFCPFHQREFIKQAHQFFCITVIL